MKTPDVPKKILRFWNEQVTSLARNGRFSTGLLIVSSAALGGIAVALWNRKTLTTFHELEQRDPAAPSVLPDEVEDLFDN